MRHPSNRAERRQAREVARRTHPSLRWQHGFEPRECRNWNRGGKQYFACGNRCAHSRESRYLARLKVKWLRRAY